MLSKKLRTILKAIFALILLGTALILLLNVLVQNSSVQDYLIGQLSKTTGYNLKAGKLKLKLRDGVGFSALDLVAESRIKPERFEAAMLSVVLDVTQLIRGRIIPVRIFLSRPRVEMDRVGAVDPLKDHDGDIFTKMIAAGLSGLRSGVIEGASVCIKGLPFELQHVDFEVHSEGSDPVELRLNLMGEMVSHDKSVLFTLLGSIHPDKRVGSDLVADLSLKTGKFPLTWIPCPACLPFSEGIGEVDVKIQAERNGLVSVEGKIQAEDVRFSVVRRERYKDYALDFLEVDFASSYSEKSWEILSLKLKGPDFSVSANSKLDYKDKSNPHIFFHVETPFMNAASFKRIFPTPLIRPWIEDEILSIISGGHARLHHYSMSGTCEQFRRLKAPGNEDVISMKVLWKDVSVLKENSELPFERVSGAYSFERGVHETTISNGYFGNSSISSASLISDKLFGDYVHRLEVKGLFELDDLRRQGQLYFLPASFRSKCQEFQKASGNLEGYIQIGFKPKLTYPRILEGNFYGKKCLIEHKDLFLPLSIDEAEFLIKKERECTLKGNGHWGKSQFQVSGSADSQWESGKISVLSRVHPNEIVDRFFKGRQFTLDHKGLVPCQLDIDKFKDSWSFQGEVALSHVGMKTGSVFLVPPGKEDRAAFDLKLIPGKEVCVNNVKLNFGGSDLELNGSYKPQGQGPVSFNVLSDQVLLEDLGIQFDKKRQPVKGAISCQAHVQSFFNDPLETLVTGTINGKNISFALNEFLSPVSDGRFKLEFSGKKVVIHSFGMDVGRSTVNIQGRLQGWDGLKGTLAANSDFLDFSDFINKEAWLRRDETEVSRFLDKSEIQLSLNAQKGQWEKIECDLVEAEGSIGSGVFMVDRCDIKMEHGSLAAKGHMKCKKGPERLFFTSDIELKNQPFNELGDSLGFGYLSGGLLTLEASISAKGDEIKDCISGLTGSSYFLWEEGRIKRKRGVVFKILEILNLQNIIKRRMPDFRTKGFYLESLEAHAEIREGTIQTEDLVFKSPIFNAAAQGTVCLPTEKVDLDLWIQTLETMDNVVGKVPIIGYILTEKEKSPKGVLIYPYKVEGHWSDPKIKSSVLKNLGSGVLNIFKRILQTPERIFKEISELTTGAREEQIAAP